MKLFCLSLSQKQLESPRLTLCVGFSGFVRMGEPGPCFDLHFDRFDGLMFKAENPFENVCATTGLPSSQEKTFLEAHTAEGVDGNV